MSRELVSRLTALLWSQPALALLGVASAPAQAQDQHSAGAMDIEQVVVTARKRNETTFEIPEAISTVSAAAIEQGAISGLEDVGNVVPNLFLSERADGLPNVIMRGIGSFGNTQGVGFYIDDVQMFYDPATRFGDLERIEVLKGPQGTLYGGTNIGGAVKFVTRRPDPTQLDGNVEVQLGEQSTQSVAGALNVPLGTEWATRLFAFWGENDGFLVNPGGPTVTGLNPAVSRHVDAQKEEGARLQLFGSPTDRLSVYAWARYNRTAGGNNDYALEFDQNYQYSNIRNLSTDPRHVVKTSAVALQLDYEFGFATLTSLSAYTDTDYQQNSDPDFSRDIALFTYGTHELETLTQEVRLTSAGEGPFEWTVGASYKQQDNPIDVTLEVHPLMAATLGIIPVPDALNLPESLVLLAAPFEQSDNEQRDLSGFLNGSYRFDNFELGVGLRVDNWQVDRMYRPTGSRGRHDEIEYLPKVSASYFFDGERSMVYSTYAQGFEPGGFNETNFTGGSGLFGFEREKVDSFEVGYKGRFLEDRLQLTLVGFLSYYSDRQFELQTSDPGNPGGFVEGILNAGDSTQYGIELEGTWRLTPSLSLGFGGGVLNAEWDDGTTVFIGDAPVDIGGNTPPWVPKTSGNLVLTYERDLFADFGFWTRLQANYVGEFVVDLPETAHSDAYTLVGLGVGIKNNAWEFAINVKNLFDEKYYTDMASFTAFNPMTCIAAGRSPGCPAIATILGQPRLAVASVRFRF